MEDKIEALEKILELYQRKLYGNMKEIEYPHYWNEEQDGDIRLYDVPMGSEEFMDVQERFKQGAIKKLERIQNKIIYQKYYS